MQKFYLTKSLNQDLEQVVHEESCLYLPDAPDVIYIGLFEKCKIALLESKKIAHKTNGCFWCCREIHQNLKDYPYLNKA
jgi:hypothetical protein